MQDGYNADALHGDLSQAQRDYVMNRFRVKNLQLLVATDVAARGLDVNDLTHIINYNLPDDPEVYVHRSGRTGRAGKKGVAISLIHSRELSRIKDLERMTRKNFVRKMVPGGKEICEKQLFNLVDKVENTIVDQESIEKYLPVIYKKLEWLSREELIKHFVSVEFNRFLAYYKDAPDLNTIRRDGHDKDTPREPVAFSRLHINLGNRHELNAGSLISLINRYSSGRRIEIGKIEILRNFSFFEVEAGESERLVKELNGASFDGIPLTVEFSKPVSSAVHKNETFRRKEKKNPGMKRNRTKSR
jgi:ATP-dependent RNA helicase DeaD